MFCKRAWRLMQCVATELRDPLAIYCGDSNRALRNALDHVQSLVRGARTARSRFTPIA